MGGIIGAIILGIVAGFVGRLLMPSSAGGRSRCAVENASIKSPLEFSPAPPVGALPSRQRPPLAAAAVRELGGDQGVAHDAH
jgi:hypothetical protein